jgi:hypothetical protein
VRLATTEFARRYSKLTTSAAVNPTETRQRRKSVSDLSETV